MITIRPAQTDDVARIVALKAQAFNVNEIGQERERTNPNLDELRVAEIDGKVVGTARAIPFGHFYGGRAIDAAGISGVAVAAEARGKGVASAMMRELLAELKTRVPISSLYPATVPLYRRLGYGFGGVRTFWKARLDTLPQTAGVSLEPFTERDVPSINTAYERFALGTNGLVRRSDEWWQRRVLTDWNDKTQYRYMVREGGEVTGWIVYTLEHAGADAWVSKITARDMHWATPGAGNALLSLAALHRSTSESITWAGPPTDPVADLLEEDRVESAETFRWMLRLLDVPGAIEARGYSRLIDAAATIAVIDPLFPENAGPWRIEVKDGQAKVLPSAEPAEATADVQTWAGIWASFLRARDAVRQGGLRATGDAIEALDAIFGGPLPWIADFF
jgi:predicted acetyltransferase